MRELPDPNNMAPNSDYLLLYRTAAPEPEGIVLTDRARDNTKFLEIVKIGPDCKLSWEAGRVGCVMREFCDGLWNISRWTDRVEEKDNWWMCREENLIPCHFDGDDVEPLKGHILAEVEPNPEFSGAIAMAELYEKPSCRAKVLKCDQKSRDISVGDVIVIPERPDLRFRMYGIDYCVVKEEDVLALVA